MKRSQFESFAQESIIKVFEYGLTTIEERQEVVDRWIAGDEEFYILLACKRRILPLALIAGALIDSEYTPLAPMGVIPTKTYSDFFSLILAIEMARKNSPESIETLYKTCLKSVARSSSPVDNFQKAVDKWSETVDNFVGKTVDNSRVVHRNRRNPQDSIKLSTACG